MTNSDAHASASEDVSVSSAGDGCKGRSRFIVDPASWALVVRPDARAEIDRALYRVAHRIKFGLQLQLFSLYFLKFRLDCVRLGLLCRSKVMGLGF